MSWRVLLPSLVAVLLLLCPVSALAAQTFRPSESLAGNGGAADVTTDRAGNSAAAWNQAGHIEVARRPRGGPWGQPEDLTPAGDGGALQDPQVVFLPSGKLVAVWVVGSDVFGASNAGAGWGKVQQLDSVCCVQLQDLVAGEDGSALAFWSSGDGSAQTATMPAGATAFQPPENLILGNDHARVAVAPNGSAVAAAPGSCAVLTSVPCIHAQFRPAGGVWSDPETVGGTNGAATGLGLAARPGSRPFTAVWGESDGSVHSADRTDAGTWTTPAISVPGTAATRGTPAGCPNAFGCVDLAGRGDGLAVVWQSGATIYGSVRSGTGAWSDAETVGRGGAGASLVETAITADGTSLAAWQANPGMIGAVIRAAHRNAGGSWTQQELGPTSTVEGSNAMGDLAADGQGDGLAGFRDVDGSTRAAGFDGAAPRFTAFSLPSGGSLTFSAAATDNWSNPVSLGWTFGDGSGADGGTVSHAYTSAGTFTATATATDAVGNASQDSGPVSVTINSPPCGTTDVDNDGINDACDASNGATTPIPFKTVNATVVSGNVFIKTTAVQVVGGVVNISARAAAKAPKGFVPLQGAETIPVGATIDTTHGRVIIRSAATTKRKRKLQRGQFFRGRFRLRQVRIKKHSKKLVTDMQLTGASFKKACGARASISAKRKRSKKRVRRLFGDAKGSFRTSGRNAAATVRGTRWSVQDRCDGTLVTVQRGRVQVRDKVKRKTVFVRTGHTYLARAR